MAANSIKSRNADTVDGYHANATPTAGQIPVLDSAMAMIGGGMSRQAIINGNFDVWQRGTSVATPDVTSTHLADRWYDYPSKDSGTLPTLTRSRQALTAGEIPGAFYHTRLATNGAGTSLGNNSVHAFAQKIEYGTRYLAGVDKTVTVSFWAKSDIANKRVGIRLVQYYGSGGSPSAEEVVNGTNWTLTATWTKYTHTLTTNTLVGKTFGTDNNDSLRLEFGLMWGSTRQAQYGASSAETYVGSGNIDIAQVQLCAGDVALPFQPKSFEEELRACQRYYEKSYSLVDAPGANTAYGSEAFSTAAAGAIAQGVRFKVSKRKAPTTFKTYSTAGTIDKISQWNGASLTDLAVTTLAEGENGFRFYGTFGAGNFDGSFHWIADAEL